VADLYFKPDKKEDETMLRELSEQYPEEGETIMELMPAWKRWGYEEGIEKGKEEIIRKLLDKGFSPEKMAETIEMPVDEIRKLTKQ
jgi:predicted transposase/invertase (TIGR01784 family)